MSSQPAPTLQRVPPHDLTLEAHLLGAALLDPHAATVAAASAPHFYSPLHATVAASIAELLAEHAPTDQGTVGGRLKRDGTLDSIGGWPTLVRWVADTPTTGAPSVDHWAAELAAYHHKRRQLSLLPEILDAVYRGIPTAGLIAELHQAANQLDQTVFSSWEPVNLAAVLAGEGPTVTLTVGARSDGPGLFYPGKTHAVNAEPEAGKSWLLLAAAAHEIQGDNHVLYIDLEADAVDITSRILALGVTPAQIIDQLHYVRPHDTLDHAAVARLGAAAEAWHPTLAVIDGVTEAMSAAGCSIADNDDIARFYALLPRPLARAGAAVVLIDHVVKDKESQGRWGIGGQHKLAGIDGATYKLETITPFARGKAGSSRLVVSKDRHGLIRANATPGATQIYGIVHFNPGDEGAMEVTVDPVKNDSDRTAWVPTKYMVWVSQALQAAPEQKMSKRAIRTTVKGDNKWIDLAIEHLAARWYIRSTPTGYVHLLPYQAPDDERSDDERYEGSSHSYQNEDL